MKSGERRIRQIRKVLYKAATGSPEYWLDRDRVLELTSELELLEAEEENSWEAFDDEAQSNFNEDEKER